MNHDDLTRIVGEIASMTAGLVLDCHQRGLLSDGGLPDYITSLKKIATVYEKIGYDENAGQFQAVANLLLGPKL